MVQWFARCSPCLSDVDSISWWNFRSFGFGCLFETASKKPPKHLFNQRRVSAKKHGVGELLDDFNKKIAKKAVRVWGRQVITPRDRFDQVSSSLVLGISAVCLEGAWIKWFELKNTERCCKDAFMEEIPFYKTHIFSSWNDHLAIRITESNNSSKFWFFLLRLLHFAFGPCLLYHCFDRRISRSRYDSEWNTVTWKRFLWIHIIRPWN